MRLSENWQVESLRITAFPVENESVSPSKLWETHVGEPEPEIHIQPGKINQRNAKQEYGDIYLVKTVNQIEWRFVVSPSADLNEQSHPVWGDLEHGVHEIRELSNSLLQDCNILPLSRLAFGAELISPTLELNTIREQLSGLLPRMDLAKVVDFAYQVNRIRESNSVDGLHINRLSRWNVATIVRNDSTLDSSLDIEQRRTSRIYAARLVLDINTVPIDNRQLPTDSLLNTFEELLRMGLEISSQGDIH